MKIKSRLLVMAFQDLVTACPSKLISHHNLLALTMLQTERPLFCFMPHQTLYRLRPFHSLPLLPRNFFYWLFTWSQFSYHIFREAFPDHQIQNCLPSQIPHYYRVQFISFTLLSSLFVFSCVCCPTKWGRSLTLYRCVPNISSTWNSLSFLRSAQQIFAD